MKSLPETTLDSPTQVIESTEFLQYLSQFLVQFTRMAEAQNLHQIAYFLSMAALETHDHLDHAQAKATRALNRAA
jgi:hypothetical protein